MPPRAPNPPKKAPAKKVAPHIVVRDAVTPVGLKVTDKKFVDQALYPGLMFGDAAGINGYKAWLNNYLSKSTEQSTLVARGGAGVQAILWRAHVANRDPNDTLNEIADKFGTDIFAPIGGGGGGGRGGGGGGPSAEDIAKQVESAKAEVRNRAATLGRPLSEDEVTFLATAAVNENWSGAQLDDQLMSDPSKITEPGLVQVSSDQIKAAGSAQLMNVSDETARQWALRINSGEMDITAVQSIFQQQALAEFGWAAESLKSGLTMRDILTPARDKIASELEIGANQVDLMDPKYRQMAQQFDKDGKPRAATMTEVTQSARKDAQWANTANAARLAANTAQLMRQTFEGQ
jgi:hypothetical protein